MTVSKDGRGQVTHVDLRCFCGRYAYGYIWRESGDVGGVYGWCDTSDGSTLVRPVNHICEKCGYKIADVVVETEGP